MTDLFFCVLFAVLLVHFSCFLRVNELEMSQIQLFLDRFEAHYAMETELESLLSLRYEDKLELDKAGPWVNERIYVLLVALKKVPTKEQYEQERRQNRR